MVKKDNREKASGLRGRCFLIYARALPTAATPEPKVVCARVYAANAVFARSRFWKLSLRQYKLKKARGEVLRVEEVNEKDTTTPRNFGVFLKYRSTIGVHNTFKEYRDTTVNGAINQMYDEMGGNHHVSSERIEIISVKELQKEELRERKPRCLLWNESDKIRYPLWKRTARPTHKKYTATFKTNRPCVMKTGKSITA